ncbi:amino acid adenylation domain-containing protein [Kitasatospora sp. NPDC056327]|uniref:non-ribosomal peptide synthetase n=1 Tax=Kitasatospora sp. NPDC056327 TaxID=3345785 RepID=UPI0035E112A9
MSTLPSPADALVRLTAYRAGAAARPAAARGRVTGPAGPPGTGRAVRTLADRLGTGADAVLLAAFGVLTARYSGQSTVAFGLLSPGTVRTAVLDTTGDPAVGAVVRQAAERLAEPDAEPTGGPTGGPADGPSGGGAAPSAPTGEQAHVGFALRPVTDRPPAPYGELTLGVGWEGEEPVFDAEFDTGRFDDDAVHRLLGHLRTLLAAALADPGVPVSRLPLLTGAELHTVLVEWNDTRADLPLHDGTVHGAFARRAAERPDAVALVEGGRRHDYAGIDAAANRLAHHLRSLGVRRGNPVGLALHRSADFLIATLAVMKAGAAYVPLDPAYPQARLQSMLADAACPLVVSHSDLADRFAGTPVAVLELDTAAAAIAAQDSAAPAEPVGPDDLCYVIYTSGSTGRPKGIALRHGGVLNNLLDLNTRYGVGPGDSVLALSSLSFDMSVYEFLGLTVAGGTVVVPERGREKDPAHWAGLLRRHRVTVWNSAPPLLELLATHAERTGADLSSLRLSLNGGDWVPLTLPDRVRAHAPGLRFVVLGGATEASIHSTVYEVGRVDPAWASIPYGRPMANQRTYVLDPAGQPVPAGVAGELYLAGDGLARGYLGAGELTAARFAEWSYGPVRGERLYRTGDLVRYGADGVLELLGRIDFQVKIRGVRIETGEVEAAVAGHPAVQACVVAAHGAAERDRRLVAHVVLRPGRTATAAELREYAAGLLPAAMAPAAVVLLDALPLTPNGKVDRRSLPAPVPAARAAGGRPADAWEERVAEAWAEVLGMDEVGRDSDFFQAGGDSLSAMRVAQRIDPGLPVTELFTHRTVRELAARLRALAAAR